MHGVTTALRTTVRFHHTVCSPCLHDVFIIRGFHDEKMGKRRHIEMRILIAFVDIGAYLGADDGCSFAKVEKDREMLWIQSKIVLVHPNLPLSRRRDNDGYL